MVELRYLTQDSKLNVDHSPVATGQVDFLGAAVRSLEPTCCTFPWALVEHPAGLMWCSAKLSSHSLSAVLICKPVSESRSKTWGRANVVLH
jgi:hypothetical protein